MSIRTKYANTPDGNAPIQRENYANHAHGNASSSEETEYISTFQDRPDTDERTIVVPSPGADIHKPASICVGWVVAIKGPMLGKSFSIYLGQNHVGSESRNDIVISKTLDSGISGYNHINLEYDQKLNQYFISRGNEGHSLAYVNGERLSGGQERELTRGDIIELSNLTILRFVPFCDEIFDWSKISTEEDKYPPPHTTSRQAHAC